MLIKSRVGAALGIGGNLGGISRNLVGESEGLSGGGGRSWESRRNLGARGNLGGISGDSREESWGNLGESRGESQGNLGGISGLMPQVWRGRTHRIFGFI